MYKNILLALLSGVLFVGCTTKAEKEEEALVGRGGVKYGGEFRFYSPEVVSDVFPLTVSDVYSQRVSGQIFQGLLRISPDGTKAEPALAESYTISDDAKTFTFKIRKGVHFQDDACFDEGNGREVKAKDFKYCFELACKNDPKVNQFSWLLTDRIVGAKDYFDGKANEVTGIRVPSDYELVIELSEPFAGFEKVLTHPALVLFPKEALDKYGEEIGLHAVGTGPFRLASLSETEAKLERNPKYWEKDEFGNELPYLSSILVQFNGKKIDELMAFRKEEIDLVLEIPVDEIQNVLGTLIEAQEGKNVKHRVASVNSLNIEYIGFAHNNSVFNNPKVRKAFNTAINRQEIVERDLNGDVIAVENGFVPYMSDYPVSKVHGHVFDAKKAATLLEEAGYPGGKGFPVVDFYVNTAEGSASYKMAEAIVRSLKENLGVNVNIKKVSYQEREDAIKSGEAVMWRGGWLADYPDPENFLNIFVGGDETQEIIAINPFNYSSEEFNKLFDAAKKETDLKKRMDLYAQCDQLIIDDAVVMPLFNKDFITMVNLKAKKFETNQMERLDFTRVYIKELEGK